MEYKQFQKLFKLASQKKLTLAEYDTLYKECNGDHIKMESKLKAM